MKKTLLTIIVSLIGAMVSVSWAQEAPIKVACVGNSITEGVGTKSKKTESYPAVMQRIMGEKYEVKNFGYSGRTMLNKGDRPYMKEDRFRKALAFHPDIVTIKLGTNDSKPWNWKFKDEFKTDMCAMIDSFQMLPSKPQVYLCLPVPPVYARWTITDSVVHDEVIPMILEVAKERNLPVIDLYTPLKPYPELFPDSIHPNRGGAAVIAEEVARRIMMDVQKAELQGVDLKTSIEASLSGDEKAIKPKRLKRKNRK